MNILITGSKGFIGRHFMRYLSHQKKNRILEIDIKDGKDCRDFFKEDNRRKSGV